ILPRRSHRSNDFVRAKEATCRRLGRTGGGKKGAAMTNMDMASGGAELANAEDCFGLGMVYSSGAGVAVDFVQAHKGFNIAGMRGHQQAGQLRCEVAEQMSDSEIGCAQRAARDWLKAHPKRRRRRAYVRRPEVCSS